MSYIYQKILQGEAHHTLPHWNGCELISSQEVLQLSIENPSTEDILGHLPLSISEKQLDDMIAKSQQAQISWSRVSVKQRVQVLYELKKIIESRINELGAIVSLESGKTLNEAKGGIQRGLECIEFACSLPQLLTGSLLEVSDGIECKQIYEPLGIVAGITPFNFPLMVPLWMAPLAIGCGNAFILKPSEQTPLSGMALAHVMKEAGVPEGIFSVVHGGKESVEALCHHKGIQAIGFVGSSPVAQIVRQTGVTHHKRVRALGGAKNYLIVLEDADPKTTALNIVASATGCCGQRCMAASVVITVGNCQEVIEQTTRELKKLLPGKDLGPLINRRALDKVRLNLEQARQRGNNFILEENKTLLPQKGYFMAPVFIECYDHQDPLMHEELFAPVLTLHQVKDLKTALDYENQCRYGNAATIYTNQLDAVHYFSKRAQSGMLGVNVGVPVPREPFPFGGWHQSSFAEGDLTGRPGLEFWTKLKKITTKWGTPAQTSWMS